MNKAIFLDQNFLIDETIYSAIRSAPEYNNASNILEIGPGKGFITSMLFQDNKTVSAIEIDPYLVKKLHNDFRGIQLFEGDAYRLLNDPMFRKKLGKIELVISSIPYSRAQNILHCFASEWIDIPLLLGVPLGFKEKVQQDFYLGSYFTCNKIKDIPKTSYNPQPKVDSELILVSKISQSLVNQTFELFMRRYLYKHEKSKLKNALVEGLIEFSMINDLEYTTQKLSKARVVSANTTEFDLLVSECSLQSVKEILTILEPNRSVQG
jgi:16S rRNA (adenine1518-N6/adenine1519-N6)-dimethyltransferase